MDSNSNIHCVSLLETDHKDVIQDVSYDFYGKRVLTCSSDQYVKVWDIDDDGKWTCSSSWKTHSSSVWKALWADPEFGQLIATCSMDRTVIIWEEQIGEISGSSISRRWVKKATLVDSKQSVTDICFCPRHLGLQLTTVSKDGTIRIYEAPDIVCLSHWSMQFETTCGINCNSVSWSSSQILPPLIVVGCGDKNMTSSFSKLQLLEFKEKSRNWVLLNSEDLQLNTQLLNLFKENINDVAFSPSLGRKYYLLAVAGKGLKLLKISNLNNQYVVASCSLIKDDESIHVWKVKWNVLGSTLACSCDDGSIQIWKSVSKDVWKCDTIINSDGSTKIVKLISTEMKEALTYSQIASLK